MTHAETQRQQQIERAVERCFVLIGGGMTHTRAVAYVAEHDQWDERELRQAYDAAIDVAAESD